MGLNSVRFLPDLERLPGDRTPRSFREKVEALRSGDARLMAAEAVAAGSIALWAVWDQVNVPDELQRAYETQYPELAEKLSLDAQWQEVQERGPDAAAGMISGLKGKLAELRAAEMLEQAGYGDVNIAASPVQQTWDISALSAAGEPVSFQVKTGAEAYAGDVMADIAESADVEFLVSSEIAAKILESDPAYADGIIDIGPDYELVGDVRDGLETLADNQGIDLPDPLGDLVPYVGGALLAVSLIRRALKTEREFKDADRTAKNRIHVVRTLTMMSRFGVNAVLTSAGLAGGSALGGGPPGALVGGGAGLGLGLWLNKRLRGHMLDLALNITRLTRDDLFFFKNQRRIDQIGLAFRARADELCGGRDGAASPAARPVSRGGGACRLSRIAKP